MAAQASAAVLELARGARSQQATPASGGGAASSFAWSLPVGAGVTYKRLQGEVEVGGVYCRLLLKEPHYPLRDPLKVAHAMADALATLLGVGSGVPHTTGGLTAGSGLARSERVALLSATLVALVRAHGLLADHLAGLGYVGGMLASLAARPPTAGVMTGAAAGTNAAAAATAGSGGVEATRAAVRQEADAALRLLHALLVRLTSFPYSRTACGEWPFVECASCLGPGWWVPTKPCDGSTHLGTIFATV